MLSLREWYGKLSAPIHTADEIGAAITGDRTLWTKRTQAPLSRIIRIDSTLAFEQFLPPGIGNACVCQRARGVPLNMSTIEGKNQCDINSSSGFCHCLLDF
jgi:hypothetical protein